MKNKILIFLVCIFCMSCKKSNEQEVSINQLSRDIDIVINEVNSGNTDSYDELKIIYLDYSSDNLLPYAKVMADKYNYSLAFLDVYYCFKWDLSGKSFKDRDKKTQKIMMEYLNQAVKRGVDGAKEELQEINNPKEEDINNNEAKE